MQPKLKSMKQLVFLIVIFLTVGCTSTVKENSRRLIKEIIIEHPIEDSVYKHYGYYKEIFRVYNYHYADSFMSTYALDSIHHVESFINEYGDTIHKIYIDVSNYPRREE